MQKLEEGLNMINFLIRFGLMNSNNNAFLNRAFLKDNFWNNISFESMLFRLILSFNTLVGHLFWERFLDSNFEDTPLLTLWCNYFLTFFWLDKFLIYIYLIVPCLKPFLGKYILRSILFIGCFEDAAFWHYDSIIFNLLPKVKI